MGTNLHSETIHYIRIGISVTTGISRE